MHYSTSIIVIVGSTLAEVENDDNTKISQFSNQHTSMHYSIHYFDYSYVLCVVENVLPLYPQGRVTTIRGSRLILI